MNLPIYGKRCMGLCVCLTLNRIIIIFIITNEYTVPFWSMGHTSVTVTHFSISTIQHRLPWPVTNPYILTVKCKIIVQWYQKATIGANYLFFPLINPFFWTFGFNTTYYDPWHGPNFDTALVTVICDCWIDWTTTVI